MFITKKTVPVGGAEFVCRSGCLSSRARMVGAVSSVALLIGGASHAQDSTSESEFEMEQIIVSAQKREQSQQDVPISMTVFNSQRLELGRIDSLDDYFAFTPNVALFNEGSRSEVGISIRGVQQLGGNTQIFGQYIDEVSVASGRFTTNINPQLQDIERIEVLKGPQGTLFGRNAAAGAISIHTKKPDNDFYAEGTVDYGRFNTALVRGIVNVPIVEDKLMARAVAFFDRSDGFVKNVNPAGTDADWENWGGRLSLRFMPNDRITIDSSVTYQDENEGAIARVGIGFFQSQLDFDLCAATFPPLGGACPPDPEVNNADNRRLINHDLPEFTDNNQLTLINKIEYEGNGFTVTSVTGYLDHSRIQVQDADRTSLAGEARSSAVEFTTFSQELRVQSNNPDADVDWIVGAFYGEDKTENFLTFIDLGLIGSEFFDTSCCGGGRGFGLFTQRRDDFTDSFAVFADATWHATDKLDLTAGVRFSHDKAGVSGFLGACCTVNALELSNVDPETFRPSIDDSQGLGALVGINPDVEEIGRVTASFDDISPRFVATYFANDDLTVYASASRGYKSGGLETSSSARGRPFDEEHLWNYEVGAKGAALGGRLQVNAAAFYMDWRDLQVTSFVDVPNETGGGFRTVRIVDNAGQAKVKGFELDLLARPFQGVSLAGAVGFIDGEFGEGTFVFEGEPVDPDGRRLPLAPKWTASLIGQYDFDVTDRWRAYVRAEWFYRGSIIQEVFPDVEDFVDGYNVTNLRAGIQNDRFSIVGYVENVFNKDYVLQRTDDLIGFIEDVHPVVYGIRLIAKTG